LEQPQQLGLISGLFPNQPQNNVLLDGVFSGFAVVVRMNEIAPFAVHTTTVLLEVLAFLGFVLVVHLVVFEELVRPVREFAAFFVGTKAKFHVTSTQL
jgi:hypothetical protein